GIRMVQTCYIPFLRRACHGTRAAAGRPTRPGSCPAAMGVRSAGRGVHMRRRAGHPLAPVGPVEGLNGSTSITNGLRVMAERYGRIGMAGDLRDQAHLDPLCLKNRNEGVPGGMGRDIRKLEGLECRCPITLAEVLVEQRSA